MLNFNTLKAEGLCESCKYIPYLCTCCQILKAIKLYILICTYIYSIGVYAHILHIHIFVVHISVSPFLWSKLNVHIETVQLLQRIAAVV